MSRHDGISGRFFWEYVESNPTARIGRRRWQPHPIQIVNEAALCLFDAAP
jgi:hypothetical protein